ncbi:MAG: protein kinase [Gemmataceae bacterium]
MVEQPLGDCPSEAQWIEFLAGLSPETEERELSDHANGCPACSDTMARLSSTPPWLEKLVGEMKTPTDPLDEAFQRKLSLAFKEASLGPSSDRPDQEQAYPNVPGFRILGVLGEGANGVVYKAHELNLGRTVAIKTLKLNGFINPTTLARFEREAKAIGQLSQPGIVQIHQVNLSHVPPYLVLEFCEGGSLAEKLNGKPLEPIQAASIAHQLSTTLQAAHRKGILHRDLKPANILLPTKPASSQSSTQWVVKISDFGLAKQAGNIELSQTGEILGTPNYMAPEQIQSDGCVGPATDVYGLGAVLYAMLTGRPPFQSTDFYQTLELVKQTAPILPRQLQPTIPRDLETICLHCLEKEPKRRYQSAEALEHDLSRFLNHKPIEATRPGLVRKSWLFTKRNPWGVGFVVALLIGFSVSIVLLLRARSAEAVANENAEKAKQHAKQALLAQEKATQNEEKAYRTLTQSLKVGSDFYLILEEDSLIDSPGMTALRNKLLTKALEYNQSFISQWKHEPKVKEAVAQALLRVGQMQGDQGAEKDALATLEEAYQKLTELGVGTTLPIQLRLEVATCCYFLGLYNARGNKQKEALRRYREAQAIFQEVFMEDGKKLERHTTYELERQLALTIYGQARLHADLNNFEEARLLFVEAINRLETVVPQDSRVLVKTTLAMARTDFGLFSLARARITREPTLRQNYFQNCISQQNKVIALLEDLSSQEHKRISVLEKLANAYLIKGLALVPLKQMVEAERSFEKTAFLRRQLVVENPTVARFKANLGSALENQAQLLLMHNPKNADALSLFLDATQLYRKALEVSKNVEAYKFRLMGIYWKTLPLQQQQGLLTGAKKTLHALTSLVPPSPENFYRLSAGFGQLCLLFDNKEELTEEEIAAKQECQEESLKKLQLAIQNGFRDAKRLTQDKRFSHLHTDPRFQELLQQISSKSNKIQ